MKKVLLVIALSSAFVFSALAGEVCGEPRQNVTVRIEHWYLSDIGTTFCYAKEEGTSKRLEILDCGFYVVDDVVPGRVLTHWTHRNEQGTPVCDYQQFIPYKL